MDRRHLTSYAALVCLLVSACDAPSSGDADAGADAGLVVRDAAIPPGADASRVDDAAVTCTPLCDDPCGSDGCGGSCGACPDAGDACASITAEPYENNEGNAAEFTAKFFPTDNRDDEYIDMFFRSDALGTHRYGEGPNADLYTCDQCMLIVRNDSVFYPTAGTITIREGSDPLGRRLVATLSELELIEIEISDSYHSIPVPGGECLRLAGASIDAR